MKMSPQDKKLDEMLRSSALVAGGFMGDDTRCAAEIIEADAAELHRCGVDAAVLAQRMRDLTTIAKQGLGTWVDAEEGGLRVMSEEYKGRLVCPWAHAGYYDKRVTIAERPAMGQTLSWTDLNVHLIEAHGFFEGKGSAFRIEPDEAVRVLFVK